MFAPPPLLYHIEENTTGKDTKKALTCQRGHDLTLPNAKITGRCRSCKRVRDMKYWTKAGWYKRYRRRLSARIIAQETRLVELERIVREQENRYRDAKIRNSSNI